MPQQIAKMVPVNIFAILVGLTLTVMVTAIIPAYLPPRQNYVMARTIIATENVTKVLPAAPVKPSPVPLHVIQEVPEHVQIPVHGVHASLHRKNAMGQTIIVMEDATKVLNVAWEQMNHVKLWEAYRENAHVTLIAGGKGAVLFRKSAIITKMTIVTEELMKAIVYTPI